MVRISAPPPRVQIRVPISVTMVIGNNEMCTDKWTSFTMHWQLYNSDPIFAGLGLGWVCQGLRTKVVSWTFYHSDPYLIATKSQAKWCEMQRVYLACRKKDRLRKRNASDTEFTLDWDEVIWLWWVFSLHMAKKRIWLYTLDLFFTDTPMSQFILIKAQHIWTHWY